MYNRRAPRFLKHCSKAASPDCRAFEGPGGQVPKRKPLISIVDDDESVREAAAGLMKSLGYTAEAFGCAEDFLGSQRLLQTSCLIADVNMPGMSGLDLYRQLLSSGKPIPTILITAFPDEGVRELALSAGVIGYLSKPFDEGALLSCLHAALPSDSP
jgi:FixJ family two-component response regulator